MADGVAEHGREGAQVFVLLVAAELADVVVTAQALGDLRVGEDAVAPDDRLALGQRRGDEVVDVREVVDQRRLDVIARGTRRAASP